MEFKPLVVVQQQANDPVSLFGVWKNGWIILQVNPPADKKGPHALFDHFLNYAGFPDTEFSYADVSRKTQSGKYEIFGFILWVGGLFIIQLWCLSIILFDQRPILLPNIGFQFY